MYDASDTRQVRRAAKAAKQAEASKRTVISRLMGDPEGRTYVHDFLLRCSVFHTPFTGTSSGTDFNCGKQSVGLELLAEVVAFAPDQYIQMMRETNDKEIADGRRSDNDRSNRSGANGRGDDSRPEPEGRVDSDYDPNDDLDASDQG